MHGGMAMIHKKVLNPNRIRRINGGFGFIPHRFLTNGFCASLEQKELLLYLFLCLVSDRYGLSFYSDDTIRSLLELSIDEYLEARDGLMDKDLIDYNGTLFQVLDLPRKPLEILPQSSRKEQRRQVRALIQQSLSGKGDGQ